MTPSGKALADRAQREAWGGWEGIRQFDIPAIEDEAISDALDAIEAAVTKLPFVRAGGISVNLGDVLAVIQEQREGGA